VAMQSCTSGAGPDGVGENGTPQSDPCQQKPDMSVNFLL